jgi:undecaprenyl diphosphate synthase
MLDSIKKLIRNEKEVLKIKVPRHIAITTTGIERWALKNNLPREDALKRSILAIKNTIKLQVNLKVPILSFYILDSNSSKEGEFYPHILDAIVDLLHELPESRMVNDNKIKISVLGKWYNLPGRIVDAVKNVVEETKDYDSFFVNFCINYNGQEEIVDAMKLIAMHVRAGKIDPEMIDKGMVKDNIYSSNFLPPDLMIKSGIRKATTGFLLWDSVNTKIYFTNKFWPDFDKTEFMDAIRDYQKGD